MRVAYSVSLPDSLRAYILPVVDTDELATTFLDEHKLAKKGLYVEHNEGPDNREPVCVCACACVWFPSQICHS